MPDFEGLKKIVSEEQPCEEVLASLLDDLPIGILILDSDGMPLFMNGAALQLYGEMPVGSSRAFRPPFRMTWADGSPIPSEVFPFYRIPQREEVFSAGEIKLAWPDGRERFILVRGIPLLKDGGVLGAMFLSLDITGQRKIELALRESEERFRITFEQAEVGIANVAPDGTFLKVNPRYCDIVGYPREELLGMTFQQITHPDDLESDVRQVEDLLAGRISTYSMDKRYYRKDGSIVWVSLSVSLLREADGRPRFFISTVQDISEKKRSEEALLESEERFRATFEQAAVGITHVAPDGRFLRVNRRYCELVGYSAEELAHMTFRDITHPDDLAEDVALSNDLLAGRIETYSLEKRYVRKDRSLVWVALTGSLVWTPEGGPKYMIGIVQDISERKRAEQELERERDFNSAIQDTMGGLAIVLDREGRLVRFNPAAERMTGYAAKEVLGKPFWNIFLPPEERETVCERLAEILAGHFPNSGDNTWIAKDGTRYWIAWSNTALLDERGVVQFILSTGIDRTEAKRTEAQREQIEALKQGEALKDQFLSMVSHELRTPINSITGYGSILEDEVAGPLNEQQHLYVQRLLGGADMLLGLVNDLLDMTRIQAGRFSLTKAPISLYDSVASVIQSLRPLIERKHQILREEVPEGLPLVQADEQRVSQVLLNLLSNAIKFTPEGGTISIRAHEEEGFLVCEVEDTGIGIAPEDLPRLFKPFTQLDMSSTRKARGTGLGLTIAKALVEAHGGTIMAESAGLGKGATFRFSLPLGA